MADDIKILQRKIRDIFSKAAQEVPKNHMMVGSGAKSIVKDSFLQMHNQRFYYDFERVKGYSAPPNEFTYPTPQGSVTATCTQVNHNSEDRIENYHDCNIRVKKTQIEIIYKIPTMRHIEHSEKGEQQVIAEIQTLNNKCKTVLSKFIDQFGGKTMYKLLNYKPIESKVSSDWLIEKLPHDMRFHTSICKKVYAEQNIEYFNPAHAATYFSNLGTIEVVPSVCNAIDGLSKHILSVNPLRGLKRLVRSIDDILKQEEVIRMLTDHEKLAFSNWTFGRFAEGKEERR